MSLFNKIAFWLSLFISLFLFAFLLINPEDFKLFLAKDGSASGGLVEELTVIVLLPAIFLGFISFWKFKKSSVIPNPAYWVLIWTLAILYFAGEEASWGYWYFHWDTPEVIMELNDQGETNLHNMSSWLDQKPRILVELFIFIAGFILPLTLYFQNREVFGWRRWIYAPKSLIVAGGLFVTVRIADWIPALSKTLGSSELREFAVALFLSLYIISFKYREV
jgi:hypothetical protein